MFRDDDRFACALQALDRGQLSSAEAAFDALLEGATMPAERAFLLNKRGVARVGLELRDLARGDFMAALAAIADYAPAVTNLGNLLLENGELDAAISQYEKAIANDAEYAIAYLNLGVAYKRSGRLAEAVRALRHAQRLEERARARATSASTFWRPARRR
ncbi:MAG TPA: tetratricopeptide repeat protein [Candidatus Cybelea sp.]|nr:tetratricopeptide repeat protein [Candidatus Cybelea sp.]